jgi:hypothetical protein
MTYVNDDADAASDMAALPGMMKTATEARAGSDQSDALVAHPFLARWPTLLFGSNRKAGDEGSSAEVGEIPVATLDAGQADQRSV